MMRRLQNVSLFHSTTLSRYHNNGYRAYKHHDNGYIGIHVGTNNSICRNLESALKLYLEGKMSEYYELALSM